MIRKDLTGQRFGRLLVLEVAEPKKFPSGQSHTQFRCKCDCGKEVVVLSRNLLTGNTRSCGCLALETRTIHNKWGTKCYRTWDHIIQRCTNEKYTGYANYGGRGITVCDEWRNSFDAFYNHVSKLPHYGEEGRSIDRIDNDGNYEPGNVRWATRSEQNSNKRNSKKYKMKDARE